MTTTFSKELKWGTQVDIYELISQAKWKDEKHAENGCSLQTQKTPCWSTDPPSSFKSRPLPLRPPFLWSRCIVGRKVVAIRPLRGLRGRSENPEIHYAFKTFIYFRITYILSPGGPKRRKETTTVHLFREIHRLQTQYFCRRRILLRKWRFWYIY